MIYLTLTFMLINIIAIYF